MEKKRRVGIYGGTFSPPHLGHIHAATAFLEQGNLDELLIVPTFVTPLKTLEESTSPEDRLAMCRLAFAFSPRIFVSDIEISRGGKSYTAETLQALMKENTRLVFLCGTDMFLAMDTWYQPETIFRLAQIACMRRENDESSGGMLLKKAKEYERKYAADVFFINAMPKQMSSSEIRFRLRSGQDTDRYLSADFREYIEERGLYR